MNRALDDHQIAVRGELLRFTEQVLRTAAKLINSKAQQYLRYGVGRLAQLIGIGVVVTAFSALLPPATPESRRLRVMRRMHRDFRAAARRPSALLPRPDRWLARMFDRLEQISTESRAIQEAGQAR